MSTCEISSVYRRGCVLVSSQMFSSKILAEAFQHSRQTSNDVPHTSQKALQHVHETFQTSPKHVNNSKFAGLSGYQAEKAETA